MPCNSMPSGQKGRNLMNKGELIAKIAEALEAAAGILEGMIK